MAVLIVIGPAQPEREEVAILGPEAGLETVHRHADKVMCSHKIGPLLADVDAVRRIRLLAGCRAGSAIHRRTSPMGWRLSSIRLLTLLP